MDSLPGVVDVNGLSRFGPVPPEDAEQLPVGGDQGAVPISEGLTSLSFPIEVQGLVFFSFKSCVSQLSVDQISRNLVHF